MTHHQTYFKAVRVVMDDKGVHQGVAITRLAARMGIDRRVLRRKYEQACAERYQGFIPYFPRCSVRDRPNRAI